MTQAYDGEYDAGDDGGSASNDEEGGGALDGDVGSLTARALMKSAERGRAAAPPQRAGAAERLRSASPLKLRGKTLHKTCALATLMQTAFVT